MVSESRHTRRCAREVKELDRLSAASTGRISEYGGHIERERRHRKVQGMVPLATDLHVRGEILGHLLHEDHIPEACGTAPDGEVEKVVDVGQRKMDQCVLCEHRSAVGNAAIVMLPT